MEREFFEVCGRAWSFLPFLYTIWPCGVDVIIRTWWSLDKGDVLLFVSEL